MHSAEELADWLKLFLGLRVPRKAVCAHHVAPFEYLRRAYFEPGSDQVVWASRGGGKTRLGAAATLLDMLHKPNVQVRILGGSMEQSLKMWEYLLPDLERVGALDLAREVRRRTREVVLASSGSRVAVLPQSQKAVRGLRVQKLRCDEVELFDHEIWHAAQLVTRTTVPRNIEDDYAGDYPDVIAGTVEALSTHHKPWGLMGRVIEHAKEKKVPIAQWCLLDVLEKCPPERDCNTCELHPECQGRAKTECDGFYKIDDAIVAKRRVSLEMWQSEMMCERPSTTGAVFKTFSREKHVREHEIDRSRWQELSWGIDFGFKDPFICLWIVTTRDGEFHVVDEYVCRERVMHENLAELEGRPWGRPRWIGCDPAGSGPNDQTAQSNVDLLRRRGYRVRTCGSKIVDGIELIRAALQPAAAAPVLFVNERCAQLIKALECYHYHPTARGENPEKDGEHDHLIDALRYFFINRKRGEVYGGRRY
jgi:hypothetical protein